MESKDTELFTFTDFMEEEDEINGIRGIPLLTQVWINERNAPEILPYKAKLVETMIELLEEQAMTVENGLSASVNEKFRMMLYQTEMERVKFLIRSYLRTRLCKIEKYALYILRNEGNENISDEMKYERLSPQEMQYARQYQALIETHFQNSFLNELPLSQRRLDEEKFSIEVVTPNLDDAVFCKVKKTIGEFMLESGGDSVNMERGNIYILRYRDIQQLLKDGSVDLV